MAEINTFLCTENGETYRFDGETLQPADVGAAKKRFFAAVADPALIRSHTFKVPISTAEEKLATLVEITMFEEGGLDLEKEYAIAFVRHPLEFESSWLVEAFAVEREVLQEAYGPVIKKSGHIDLLAVPYLVYEGLYAFEKADSAKTELFIYLGDEQSYAVLCKEGRYIAHRSLPSLASVALKAKVDVEALKASLRERGARHELYGPDELLLVSSIEEMLRTVVQYVAQAVNHKRGIFGFTSVDTVLLDFEQSQIPGLWELMDGFGFEESRKGALACCEALLPAQQHVGVEALYTLAVAQERIKEAPNLTIFARKPSFWKSHTGRFVLAAGAASFVVAALGAMELSRLDAASAQVATLEATLQQIHDRSAALRKKLQKENDALAKVRQAIEQSDRDIAMYDEAADTMLLLRASQLKRRQMMKDVDLALAAYGLSATSMEQNGSRRMRIDVVTGYSERDRIAKFMKRLIDAGYSGVGTEAIKLGEDLYSSSVEVVR
jgi:cell division protein FtsB/predicted nucleic acid-binding Zn finger protein